LLDVLLPKMSGFEVLQELNKEPNTKNIPVILLTNLSQKEEIKKGMELGAKDFLIKAHFMPQEVVAKVKQVLKI
ncbi:MAG: response regulator, partial [Patescibacteria group bacterium]